MLLTLWVTLIQINLAFNNASVCVIKNEHFDILIHVHDLQIKY